MFLFTCRFKGKTLVKYEKYDKEMSEAYDWPPISSETPMEKLPPVLPRPTPTVTVVNSPPPKRRINSVGK